MTAKSNKKSINIVRRLSPVLIGLLVFLSSKNVIVQAMVQDTDLSQFLVSNDVSVSTKKGKNSHRQIKYEYDGNEIEVTNNDVTNADPVTDGEYIVWMAQVDGYWQIMLYYIPGEQTIQLTSNGNNVNPSISGKNVVWEGQVNGVWQIFLFDGIRTTQLTFGELPSQNAGIEGDTVVYSQKISDGVNWKVYMYDINTHEFTDLTKGTFGNSVSISNNVITWVQLVDGEMKQQRLSLNSFEDSVPNEDLTPTVDEEVDVVVEELVVEEDPIIEVEEASGATTTLVSENSPEEILELIIEPEEDLPEEVTEEDIKEELGIEEVIEEEIDLTPEELTADDTVPPADIILGETTTEEASDSASTD